MKKRVLLVVFSALICRSALAAADVSGDWQVKDGSAHIRIAICGDALWGVVAWERSPGTDSENPDPTKRTRPTLGIPILLNMKPVDGSKWAGQIYNAENGKTYQASVTALSSSALKVEGCVLGGLFCGGETWTRASPASSGRDARVCTSLGLSGTAH